MNLKVDYKNDKFSGKRKYVLTENPDKTISLDDVTQYQETGDIFSADDINLTNKAVNENHSQITENEKKIKSSNEEIEKIKKIRYATLNAASWSASSPFTQTVVVNGITEADSPIIGGPDLKDNPSPEVVKNRNKAFGCIDRVVSGGDYITAYCFNSKPTVDFSIIVKGV